ncbi:hypothetical protein [Alteromonas sediminis]|uniref:hypothetical protein n=1 Tax=Alteromonas sediminis TaxID=2259342 RepID=UPI0014055824|nr:hypothetical protein [Alteromonas sediminis]
MNKVSKRLISSAVLLFGWVMLITVQWNDDQSLFSAFIALPVVMLLMGVLAALTECSEC